MNKEITLMKNLTFLFLLLSLSSFADNIYESLTNGKCKTMECFNKQTMRNMSNGECETIECVNKQTMLEMSNGECETLDCYLRDK